MRILPCLLPLLVAALTSMPGAQVGQGSGPEVLVVATHERLLFDQDVTRIAVGRSETLSVEILNSRELLVLAREPGRTTLVIWFADGTTETKWFQVEPDLSVLRAALPDLHPSLTVEAASDRDSLVLRGIVPDLSFLRTAEETASAWLESSRGRGASTPLVATGEGTQAGGPAIEARPDEVEDRGNGRSAVINLIRLESLPPLADERMREALISLVDDRLTVRRVTTGSLPDDAADVFVLEGTVPDQVTLSRVLFLASRALLGAESQGNNEIRVLADEAGALTQTNSLFGAGAGAGGGGQGGQGGGSLGVLPGQGGGGNQQQLVNRIGSNLGRAKVIEAAGGAHPGHDHGGEPAPRAGRPALLRGEPDAPAPVA